MLDTDIAIIWDKFYEHFKVMPKLTSSINSAFRTSQDNKNCGGALLSKHVSGCAVDFVCKNISPLSLAQFAEKLEVGGIGMYGSALDFSKHIHIDTRARKARWWGMQSKIKTHYFGGVPCEFRLGDRSPAISSIQQKLNLNLNKINIDGVFGEKTKKAIIKFQENSNLLCDGVFGKNTNKILQVFSW